MYIRTSVSRINASTVSTDTSSVVLSLSITTGEPGSCAYIAVLHVVKVVNVGKAGSK